MNDLKITNVEIPCVGYSVAADWYQGTNDEVLLVLIGYLSTKATYHDLIATIVEQTGTSALVIDYSGHGKSPYNLQDLTPAQNFLEVITAYDWLSENHPKKKISVMGGSYGGFMAIQLTKYRSPKKLVLQAPAIYRPDMFYTKFKDLPRQPTGTEYRSNPKNLISHPLLTRAKKFKGSTFVVVHELDDVCPPATTDAIIQAFDADSWVAPGFIHSMRKSHVSKEQIDEYQNKIADWLEK